MWQRWKTRPQGVWLRRAVFQVHLWSGVAIGLYVFVVSLTGSVVVYRNELYAAAQPPSLVGDRNPPLYRFVTWLLSLHDDLLGGETGRRVNGIGALLVIVLVVTGSIVWWPGIQSWRRSLMVRRHTGWRRLTWDLHSAVGFWTLGIILMFALSGAYLCFPESFQTIGDWLQPPTDDNATSRIVDKIFYWLAYLHVGRVYGIALPCNGPGLCDQATKLAWAFFGLAPAVMSITGILMWWNRVVRKRLRQTGKSDLD